MPDKNMTLEQKEMNGFCLKKYTRALTTEKDDSLERIKKLTGLGRFMLFISLIFCLTIMPGCSSRDIEKNQKPAEIKVKAPSHPSFVTRQEFNAILAKSQTKTLLANGRIISMVMPHHLVAGHLIVDALETLVPQSPSLVILIGPNHTNKGGKSITGYAGWQTPEGIVPAQQNVVKYLLDQGQAVRDEEVLSNEHSVGALVPFIKHFLPKASVVPIILHHDVSLQEIDTLLQALKPFLDKNAVLISSVDFSHYLTRSEAQAKDQQTIRYMENFDYATLFGLGNDYLDSPASLAAAFRLAEKQGINKFTVLDNTNAGMILQNDFIETTSYFTLMFNQ